jgi:hypothetical protein
MSRPSRAARSGDPPKPGEDPVDVSDIFEGTNPRAHHVFSGKIDKSKLSFGEKAILIAVRAAGATSGTGTRSNHGQTKSPTN